MIGDRSTVEIAAGDGTLSGCSGAKARTFLQKVTLPQKGAFAEDNTSWGGDLTCTNWCTFVARLEEFPSGKPVYTLKADGPPNTFVPVVFPPEKLPLGKYRMVVRVWSYGKVGTAVARYGAPFTVEKAPAPAGGG